MSTSIDLDRLGEDVPLLEGIRTCRALRRLKPDPVPPALIRKVCEAGQPGAPFDRHLPLLGPGRAYCPFERRERLNVVSTMPWSYCTSRIVKAVWVPAGTLATSDAIGVE